MESERKRSNGNVMIIMVMMMICMNMCMMVKGAKVPSPPPKCSQAWCYAKCAGQCLPWAGPFCPLICYKSCQDRCHSKMPNFVCQFNCLSARCPQLKQPNTGLHLFPYTFLCILAFQFINVEYFA